MSPLGRAYAVVFSLGLLVAVAWPLTEARPRDSFPISNYPMFSTARKRKMRVVHVVAVGDPNGSNASQPVPPELVVSGEVMQAKVTLRRAARSGPFKRNQFCAMVAKRLVGQSDWDAYKRVELRTDIYDVLTYFEGNTTPSSSKVHASCLIPR